MDTVISGTESFLSNPQQLMTMVQVKLIISRQSRSDEFLIPLFTNGKSSSTRLNAWAVIKHGGRNIRENWASGCDVSFSKARIRTETPHWFQRGGSGLSENTQVLFVHRSAPQN